MNTQNIKKTKHHTYTFISKVGSGNFGEAFLVQSSIDSQRYIIKVSPPNSENKTWKSDQIVERTSTQGNQTYAAT